MHGYALSFKLTFTCETLDDNNWVMDFGGLKEVKAWLKHMFDHTLAAAFNDPNLSDFEDLDDAVKLANEYENSEANRIFLFLAERYISRDDRKKFIEAIVNEHLERLISLPAAIDTAEARKRIPAKKIQL